LLGHAGLRGVWTVTLKRMDHSFLPHFAGPSSLVRGRRANGHRESLELPTAPEPISSPDYYVVAFDQFENVSVIISMIISIL
jgi:hypothetical protein